MNKRKAVKRVPGTEEAPDKRLPSSAHSCHALGPRFSDINNIKGNVWIETIHSLLSFTEGCPGYNENSPSNHLPDQPEILLSPLKEACKGELGWGQVCPLAFASKNETSKTCSNGF